MVISAKEKGKELAKRVDQDALREESQSSDYLTEVLRSFLVQFSENQRNIQFDLLENAYRQTGGEVSRDPVVTEARNLAVEDALTGYVDVLASEKIDSSELPNSGWGELEFNDAVVDGYFEGRTD